MAPEDNNFDDEEYFLKKKEDKYFLKNEDEYFNSEDKNQAGYSRYEENKRKYPRDDSINEDGHANHKEESQKRIPRGDSLDDDRDISRKQENKRMHSNYEKDESGYNEEEEYNPEVKKYKDRLNEDFFKDEDFDYTGNEE